MPTALMWLAGPGWAQGICETTIEGHDEAGNPCCDEQDMVSRGDADVSGALDVTDVILVGDVVLAADPVAALMQAPVPVFELYDVDGDGALDPADHDHLVGYLYLGTHPAPGLLCNHETCSCIGEGCPESCEG